MRAEFFDQNKNKKRRGKIPVTKLAISKTGNIKNWQYQKLAILKTANIMIKIGNIKNWQYKKLAISKTGSICNYKMISAKGLSLNFANSSIFFSFPFTCSLGRFLVR